jgi:hypothetical protein
VLENEIVKKKKKKKEEEEKKKDLIFYSFAYFKASNIYTVTQLSV